MDRLFSIPNYLMEASDLINELTSLNSSIISFSNNLAEIILNNKKIMFCGNGGSAADAQHLAAELIVRLRKNFNRKALPAITLALDTSTITACGNDLSFDEIFSRALEGIGNEGDAIFAISTSGNSKNIINALKVAREKKIKVFSLIGNNGGDQLNLSDYSLVVPSKNTAHIQEAQICLGHIIMHLLEDKLKDKSFI